ncbi:MAG: glycosyltransferase [Clostridiales bacterium]|nr:glycosyltransferase [Clostridiales bacterium]
MRIVQINAVSGYGSTGRICEEISGYLDTLGFENYIFYGSGHSDFKNSIRLNSNADAKCHALLSRISGKQAYFSSGHTRKIIAKLKELKPDVVHLHNLHSNYINLNMLLDYLRDIPTVITLHDCWFFTGKCTHYSQDGCYRWQKGCGSCIRLKKDNPSFFLDKTAKMYADKKRHFEAIKSLGVIGVSDWITNEAKKSYLSCAKHIERIYNWVDTDVFKMTDSTGMREKYKIPQNKKIILGASAVWDDAQPKFKDFVRLSRLIDDDAVIVLVGEMRGNTEKTGIISIPYTKSTAQLARIYSMADVFVHLSREDTFGKVIAEALSCGTPAVVYNSTACPELVEEGCGYAGECGNTDEIRDLIYRVFEENIPPGHCAEFVRGNFEKKKLLADTVSFYQKITN